MSSDEWELFRKYADRGSAEAAVAHLTSEGVPAQIEETGMVLGMDDEYRVYVAKDLAHRARWIFAQLPVSDAELTFLATGKLPDEDSDD